MTTEEIVEGIQDGINSGKASPWVAATATGNSIIFTAKEGVDPNSIAIDMPAGPSELLVIADEQANAAFVAADLLSQAEHGPDSQVILLSDSERLITRVAAELKKQITLLSRKKIAEQALLQSRLILINDLNQAVEVSNEYGPEHLIIQTNKPQELLTQLRNAGSIFVGSV